MSELSEQQIQLELESAVQFELDLDQLDWTELDR